MPDSSTASARIALSVELGQAALCATGDAAEAATALLVAAGELLHAKLGTRAAIQLMRSILDDVELVAAARHGRQPGEAIQ